MGVALVMVTGWDQPISTGPALTVPLLSGSHVIALFIIVYVTNYNLFYYANVSTVHMLEQPLSHNPLVYIEATSHSNTVVHLLLVADNISG